MIKYLLKIWARRKFCIRRIASFFDENPGYKGIIKQGMYFIEASNSNRGQKYFIERSNFIGGQKNFIWGLKYLSEGQIIKGVKKTLLRGLVYTNVK